MSGQSQRTFPLLLFLFCTLSTLFGQNTLPSIPVSISARNESINQILDEITLQTGYYFTYNSALISGKQKVQFKVNDMLLKDVLDSLLTDPRFDYRMIDRNIVIYKKNTILPIPINEEIDRSMLRAGCWIAGQENLCPMRP